MGGHKASLFVQNLDAVLVVIVIPAGDVIFAKCYKKYEKLIKLNISIYIVCCFFQETTFLRSAVDSEGPGPGPGPGLAPKAHTGSCFD